jgi:hypothetical protein
LSEHIVPFHVRPVHPEVVSQSTAQSPKLPMVDDSTMLLAEVS